VEGGVLGALTLTGTPPTAAAAAVIVCRVAGYWAVGATGIAVAAALARQALAHSPRLAMAGSPPGRRHRSALGRHGCGAPGRRGRVGARPRRGRAAGGPQTETSPLDNLTPRERQVLAQMAEGRSNVGIGRELTVTVAAVERHVTSIFDKLGLHQSPDQHRRVLAVLTYLRA